MKFNEADRLPPLLELKTWTVSDVTNWLHQVSLSECVTPFQERQIDGIKLANLKEKTLRSMQDVPRDKYKEIMSFVKNIPKANKIFGNKKKADEPPVVPPIDYVNTQHQQEHHQGHNEDADSDFSSDWDDEEYENYENGMPDANYENEEEWTNPQHGESWDNLPVDAPPEQDHSGAGDYLEPESTPFMDPPSPPRTRPPTRALPPPPPEETPAPGIPPRDTGARGRAPLPMPPKEEIPQSPPGKVLPPAPPVSNTRPAINKPLPEQPKTKPAPPKKPANNKIMQFANMFEQKQAEQAPTPKKPVNKTAPSFLHSAQANRIANKPAPPPVRNGTAGSNEEEDVDEDDYEKVGEDGAVAGKPLPPAKPTKLPPKPETPAKPTTERNKGLVNIFPGMDPLNSQAVRKKHENLKHTLDNLFSNNNGTGGRKQSVPNVPSSHLPQNSDRKRSEPLVPTSQLPQARFNKQKSLDITSSESEHSGNVTTLRVGVGRPDRPLPAPPGASPGRNPADRPLPPVPAMQPPSPPIQSQPRLQPPLPNPGGVRSPGRTDMPNRPLPAVPQSEEEMTIYSYPWYFGEMDRKEAMSRVEGLGQEGVFLIRKSSQGGSTDPYTLMFYDGNKVHNLHIRRRSDNKYALGKEKDNEMAFRSVPELVKFHQENPIALAGGARTTLTTCPPRR